MEEEYIPDVRMITVETNKYNTVFTFKMENMTGMDLSEIRDILEFCASRIEIGKSRQDILINTDEFKKD